MATGIETRKRNGRTAYCAVAYDKTTGRKTSRTFDTITAAKQWRTDTVAALRAGTITTDRGSTLNTAADAWLDGLRAGHIRNRSGDRYKPSAIRGYEHTLRKRVLPVLGSYRLREIRRRTSRRSSTGSSRPTPLRRLSTRH